MKKQNLLYVVIAVFIGVLVLPSVSQAGGGGYPPTADFSATPTSVTAGGTVMFTDLSSYDPTSWSWTFLGGTPGTSTDQYPSVIYNTDGVYDVTLTATNAFGSNTLTYPAYITVLAGNSPPVAAFSASPTNLCEEGTVAFIDQSTGAPTSWSWTFSGGTPGTSTLPNPSVVYNTAGTYTATLIASNANGNSTTMQTITVQACTGIQPYGGVESDVTIFPTLSAGQYSVTSDFEINNIVVFSIMGEKVFELLSIHSTLATINISEFADGIYLAKITCGNKIFQKKVIK